MEITTIGLDLAKAVFQVHAVNAAGEPVLRRKLRRSQLVPFFSGLKPCRVAMEACATAHHWARTLGALGHEAMLIAPGDVKAYVRRQKNDAADAEAICEAATRPRTRSVQVKSAAAQSVLTLHRTRHLLVRQRTMLINALRGHLAEFGIIAPQRAQNVASLIEVVADENDARLPPFARRALAGLTRQLEAIAQEIERVDAQILAWHRSSALSRRLQTIPGIGFLTASALAASIPDVGAFRSSRHFAAFIGLVPRQSSSGGTERLGRISKMGDRYLRHLLVIGATSLLKIARGRSQPLFLWIQRLLERRPARLVSVAIANKLARIAFAVMSTGQDYRSAPASA